MSPNRRRRRRSRRASGRRALHARRSWAPWLVGLAVLAAVIVLVARTVR